MCVAASSAVVQAGGSPEVPKRRADEYENCPAGKGASPARAVTRASLVGAVLSERRRPPEFHAVRAHACDIRDRAVLGGRGETPRPHGATALFWTLIMVVLTMCPDLKSHFSIG